MAKKTIDEEKLLQSALEEFTQKSYSEASLNSIIQRAGIPKGSFYYRFKDKYALYVHLLKKGETAKWNFMVSKDNAEVKEPKALTLDTDFFQRLYLQMEKAFEFANLYPQYALLSRQFQKEQGSDLYEKILKELKIQKESDFLFFLQAAYESGEFGSAYSWSLVSGFFKNILLSLHDLLEFSPDTSKKIQKERLKEVFTFLKKAFM